MLSLMQKVAEFRYLTMEEIEMVYANQSYAYSVINSLKDAGLLAEVKTGVQPRKAFYLKPRGYLKQGDILPPGQFCNEVARRESLHVGAPR